MYAIFDYLLVLVASLCWRYCNHHDQNKSHSGKIRLRGSDPDKTVEQYRLKTASIGARRIDLDDLGKGLVKPVEFPFPVQECIENDFGKYKFPFLRSNSEESFFEYPANYRRG